MWYALLGLGRPIQTPHQNIAVLVAAGAVVVLIIWLLAHPSRTRQTQGEQQKAGANSTQSTAEKPAATQDERSRSIGAATMTDDGTIVLNLRAEGPGPTIGDAQFVYPKDHKEYKKILQHLGGLKKGESKPVPPWPDD